MRPAIVVIAALLLLGAATSTASAAFHYTHKLTVKATFVDNWSLQSTGSCAPVGGGTVQLTLATTKATRFRPIGRKKGAPAGPGRLNLGVPNFAQVIAMPVRKAQGTIVMTDNTVINQDPLRPFEACPPIDKSLCGTHPIKKAFLLVGGRSGTYKYLKAHASVDGSFPDCQSGAFHNWSQYSPNSGGFDGLGTLQLGPTSAGKLMSHRHTVLQATDHKVTTTRDGDYSTITDDVTRTIEVTITKL
jgi:hypothetical protein